MPDLDKAYQYLYDQFADTPNWQKVLTVFCEKTDELRQAIVEYMTRRYIETAEGYWLDVCGIIVGLPRPDEWVSSGVFTWDSAVTDEKWDNGVWTTDLGLRTGNLVDDDTYRPLLRAKAYANCVPSSSLYHIARTIDIGFGLDYSINTVAPRLIYVTFNETVTQWQRYYIKLLAPVQADTELLFTN